MEDPLADLQDFRTYLRDSAGDVMLTRSAGKVELRVKASSKAFSEMRNRRLMKKVMAELDSTVEQLRKAGVPVNERRFTLSGLQETMTLDSDTHRIRSHCFLISVVIPYGRQNITYSQDVQEDSRGVFSGKIQLPVAMK